MRFKAEILTSSDSGTGTGTGSGSGAGSLLAMAGQCRPQPAGIGSGMLSWKGGLLNSWFGISVIPILPTTGMGRAVPPIMKVDIVPATATPRNFILTKISYLLGESCVKEERCIRRREEVKKEVSVLDGRSKLLGKSRVPFGGFTSKIYFSVLALKSSTR